MNRPMSAHPFDSRHPIDMMIGVRDRLFVISALTEQVENCSQNRFAKTCAEEAAVLIAAAEERTAIDFLRGEEDRDDATGGQQ